MQPVLPAQVAGWLACLETTPFPRIQAHQPLPPAHVAGVVVEHGVHDVPLPVLLRDSPLPAARHRQGHETDGARQRSIRRASLTLAPATSSST